MSIYANQITYQIIIDGVLYYRNVFSFDDHVIGYDEAQDIAHNKEGTLLTKFTGDDKILNLDIQQIPLENIRMDQLNVEEYVQLHQALNA